MENAYEYLQEFKNDKKCDTWLRKVIETFLQKNPNEQINGLAKDLLEIEEYTVSCEEEKKLVGENDFVVINELTHKTGVNALAENQRIRFNQQVNVIYGLNGTGKSSYFRILNEMLGGYNETPIHPNIYIDEVKPVSVEMKYSFKGKDKTALWNGENRGLAELKSMRVFDAAYTRDLLKKRSSDELVVKPYGLNIFADLISYIDKILEVANEILNKKEESKPKIAITDMQKEIADLFERDTILKEIFTIKKIFDSTKVIDGELDSKLKEVNSLREGNPKDKIEILKGKLSELDRIWKHIKVLVEKVNQFSTLVKENVEEYNNLKQQSEAHKKGIEILMGISGTDSKIWQEFVAKGFEYMREQNIVDECPFCHQKYSSHAKEIVGAYVSYLDSRSQIELGKAERKISEIESELEKWNVLCNIDEDKISSDTAEKCKLGIRTIDEIRKSLLSMLVNKRVEEVEQIDLSLLLEEIETFKRNILDRINDLAADSEGKNQALLKAEKEYYNLKSDYSVKLQQDQIEELIKTEIGLTKMKEIVSNVSGYKKKISILSKKAHNELLTIQLQDEFNGKLKKLGVNNIEIELQSKNNNGIQQTELMVRKQKEITSILSEGEQKATALALYLSEIALSKNKSTIIFDDPVNSLDHRMMQNLADLLMNIDNQIIIFTHNKMFLDCFECSSLGHICKKIDLACNKTKGKHIYLYETQSEGKNRKGVIVEKQLQNLKYYLNELEKMLEETPFTKYDESCIKLRRGVETAIDEVVFNNQTPTKLSNKKSNINWGELKKISNDNDLIDGLHCIHGRVSGGELHNGLEREVNPLDRDELVELYKKLKSLCKLP